MVLYVDINDPGFSLDNKQKLLEVDIAKVVVVECYKVLVEIHNTSLIKRDYSKSFLFTVLLILYL